MNSIHLLRLGNADIRLVDGLCKPLSDALNANVDVAALNLHLDQFYDNTRGQYNSTNILLYLREHCRDHGSTTNGFGRKILAVVQEDLFIPILTYLFGEAELGGSVAVVSYRRFQNELYGLPQDQDLLVERLRKEALHELGHTYGLVHCTSQGCVMYPSSYVEDIDFKGNAYCSSCHVLIGQHTQKP